MKRISLLQLSKFLIGAGWWGLKSLGVNIPKSAAISEIQAQDFDKEAWREVYIDLPDGTSVLVKIEFKDNLTASAYYSMVILGVNLAVFRAVLTSVRLTRENKKLLEATSALEIAEVLQDKEGMLKIQTVESIQQNTADVEEARKQLKALENPATKKAVTDRLVAEGFVENADDVIEWYENRLRNAEKAMDNITNATGEMVDVYKAAGIKDSSELVKKQQKAIKRVKRLGKLLKVIGIDLFVLLGTAVLDLILTSEQEQDFLNWADARIESVLGIEDFTGKYGISLPTAPSDIVFSVVITESFNALFNAENLSWDDSLTALMVAFGKDIFTFEVIATFDTINIEVSPEQLRSALNQWATDAVMADPYLILEGFLIAFALKCGYEIYWKGARARVAP